MFKSFFENLKIDPLWKNIIKISLIFYLIASSTFYFILYIWILSFIKNEWWNIDKSFIIFSVFCFQTVFISYSLSVFILNSNDEQQRKYHFLWLLLFLLALNPIGFIGILMLESEHKWKSKNNVVEVQENTTMIKNEKWFLFWALYSSIGMMIFIIFIPISILNIIKIIKNWKNDLIEIKELKKMAYFSSDLTLIIAGKFAF
ncbi:hypothetical protein [Spiroplasma endosymbiont of Virgichneumon dumeticola]|uniref:hypothetical protein n=1 Tax=Spiroplasma endosymbiont of Virgichneumon dumeticola TaxID=3139323 RepID=UPI0035C88DE1